MQEVSNNSLFNSLQLDTRQQQAEAENTNDNPNELGQSAFLQLMITQLENQNPLEPQDNSEFVAQLAQFSSVEGIDRLNNSFDGFSANFLSNQALQASSLVGTSVAVPAQQAQLVEGDVVGGIIEVPASTPDVTVNIYSEQGNLVEEIPLGAQSRGDLVFRWDGTRIEVNGELLDYRSDNPTSSGNFRFEVLSNQNGDTTQLATSLSANVNSVSVDGSNQLVLNLAGVGPVSINDVRQFN